MPRPLVAVTACVKSIDALTVHSVQDKYVRAIAVAAGATPVIVPALGDTVDPAEWAHRFDGFLFTGSLSNVEPRHYGEVDRGDSGPHDPRRDATALPLLRALINADVPILALCRGNQELNVACGGTLHRQVATLPGMLDHRDRLGEMPPAVRYAADRHAVRLTHGGLLARIANGASEVMVNSLHEQGIDRLGGGLVVEATAPDGLIEAIRLPQKRFILGVQWHPEACIDTDALSRAIFAAFGAALRR
jgi:putative glutamine amidotransferase